MGCAAAPKFRDPTPPFTASPRALLRPEGTVRPCDPPTATPCVACSREQTVQELVCDEGALSEATTRPLARQLCAAVAHLHAHDVCHRDLKNDNLVLDEIPCDRARDGQPAAAGQLSRAYRLRLIDFGLCAIWRDEEPPMRKVAGSLCYMAPEMIAREGCAASQPPAQPPAQPPTPAQPRTPPHRHGQLYAAAVQLEQPQPPQQKLILLRERLPRPLILLAYSCVALLLGFASQVSRPSCRRVVRRRVRRRHAER